MSIILNDLDDIGTIEQSNDDFLQNHCKNSISIHKKIKMCLSMNEERFST